MRKVAGDNPPPSHSPSVSCTRGGLPRIIPSFHRVKIKKGDDAVVRFYLSLFSVSKLIPLAARVTRATFRTIVTPSDLDSVSYVAGQLRPHIKGLLLRYVPDIARLPLNQGLEFYPSWKSIPTSCWYRRLLKTSSGPDGRPLRPYANRISCFPSFFAELGAFAFLMTFVHSREEGFSQGCLWPPFIRYPFDPENTRITNWSLDWFERRIGPYLPTCSDMQIPAISGRLCSSCTGDGKRRLFAIGNYVNQRLLKPLHSWLNSVLVKIPMDGTFDQTAPLRRLYGVTGTVHSVDLTAATDRWPLLLMFELCQALFGRSFASSAVNSTLGTNIFDVGFVKRKHSSVSFVAGQPLGYYSSWPLFALSHHLLVWYAAELVYPGVRFDRYAILGDDVVIADDAVRNQYSILLVGIGVSISQAKSIISPSGACEFAKRFLVRHMTTDLSPLSIKKIASARSPIGWYNYMCTLPFPLRLSTKLRIGGLGFKACSRPSGSPYHGKRARKYLVLLIRSSSFPLYLTLSAVLGSWLPPSVHGRLVWSLLEHFAPKDLQPAPAEVYPYPGMADFVEFSILRGWMRLHLDYMRWYYLLHQKPVVELDEFFDAPICIRTWYAPKVDLETFRFGVMFRLFDWALHLMKNIPLEIEGMKNDLSDDTIYSP